MKKKEMNFTEKEKQKKKKIIKENFNKKYILNA